jgi:hypothetical protein
MIDDAIDASKGETQMTNAMTVNWIRLGNPVASTDFDQNPDWVVRDEIGWLAGPPISNSLDHIYTNWLKTAHLRELRAAHAFKPSDVITAAFNAITNGDGSYRTAVIEWTVKEPVFAHDRTAVRYTVIRLINDETYERRDCRWIDDSTGNRTVTTHRIVN